MSAEKFYTSTIGILIAAIGATFFWGSAFPAIKLSYEALNIAPDEYGQQMLFAGIRFFLAGAMIFLFFFFLNKRLMLRKETIVPLVQLGIVQTFLQYVLFYIGLSYSTGMQGSVIAGTTSFFQLMFAHFLYSDDLLTRKKWLGIFLGIAGVIVVNLPNVDVGISFGFGELLLILAMATSAYGNIMAKERAKVMDVSYLTSYQMLFGSLGLLLAGGFTAGFFSLSFDLYTFGLLLYLSFLSAAGFILWNNVMKYNKVGRVSMYLFLVPVFGVFLSSVFLNEVLHYSILLGLALVATGIVVVNKDKQLKVQPSR